MISLTASAKPLVSRTEPRPGNGISMGFDTPIRTKLAMHIFVADNDDDYEISRSGAANQQSGARIGRPRICTPIRTRNSISIPSRGGRTKAFAVCASRMQAWVMIVAIFPGRMRTENARAPMMCLATIVWVVERNTMNKKIAALLASTLVAPVLVLGLTMEDVSAGPEGQSTWVNTTTVPDEGASLELSVEPQVNCRIDSIEGIRWRKACDWCPNLPQYKRGDCASTGLGCEQCVANCKEQFTSAGGWEIINQSETLCPI
jgi:hypothetical protein